MGITRHPTIGHYHCTIAILSVFFFALKIVKHKQTEFIEGRRSPSCFYSRDELLAALNSDLSLSSSACPALDGFSVVAVWRKAISGHWCMRRALLFVVLSFGVHLSTRYDKISQYCADFSFTFYPLQASQSEVFLFGAALSDCEHQYCIIVSIKGASLTSGRGTETSVGALHVWAAFWETPEVCWG